LVLQKLEEKQLKWNYDNAEIEPHQKVKDALKLFAQCPLESHTRLEDIIPLENRQKIWENLLTTLDLWGPQLCLPDNLDQAKFSGCFIILVISLFLIIFLGWWGIVLSILTAYLYGKSFAPYYVKIPENCTNIEKLIKHVRASHYHAPKDREEVLQIIFAIIGKYSDVPASELTLDTSLRDLGLD